MDAAGRMVRVAQEATADPRVRFLAGTAEQLPGPDGGFDLVVTTTSFDHWTDQQAGLRECARVLAPGGHLVLVDQFSALYLPTLVGSRRGKARTRRRATRLLTGPASGRRGGRSSTRASSGRSPRQRDRPSLNPPPDARRTWRSLMPASYTAGCHQ